MRVSLIQHRLEFGCRRWENPGQGGTLNHLGVEVADTGTVEAEQGGRPGAPPPAAKDSGLAQHFQTSVHERSPQGSAPAASAAVRVRY